MIDTLCSVFHLPQTLGAIPFRVVVVNSTGHKVYPKNIKEYPDDKKLLDSMTAIMKSYVDLSAKYFPTFKPNRINELGMEKIIARELGKNKEFIVEHLIEPGYPDIKISLRNHEVDVTYLEVKTSAVKDESGFRYFYYPDGSKIKHDAKHLLINIQVSKSKLADNYWKIECFNIIDLSELEVKLKTEFNASKNDMLSKRLELISYSVDNGLQTKLD